MNKWLKLTLAIALGIFLGNVFWYLFMVAINLARKGLLPIVLY